MMKLGYTLLKFPPSSYIGVGGCRGRKTSFIFKLHIKTYYYIRVSRIRIFTYLLVVIQYHFLYLSTEPYGEPGWSKSLNRRTLGDDSSKCSPYRSSIGLSYCYTSLDKAATFIYVVVVNRRLDTIDREIRVGEVDPMVCRRSAGNIYKV